MAAINYLTGKLDCSDEWWDRKIKEKPDAKKFRNKGVPPVIEELWDQLYGDVVANGSDCVTPSVDPNVVQSANAQGVQEGDEQYETNNDERFGDCEDIGDEIFAEYQRYATHLENIEKGGGDIWYDLTTDEMQDGNTKPLNQGLGATRVPRSRIRTAKGPPKNSTNATNPASMKRKKRQSMGSTMLARHLESMVEMCGRATQALDSDSNIVNNTPITENNAAMGMTVLNHMDGLEKGSDLWCYAVDLLEDARRTDLFLNMEDDATRLAWLKHKYNKQAN
ncbi:hypothetical protein RIF29_33285 [Crotalaria pallida]|uniref:Uncharacterized protein n=1 Tax=Crotalaria pallida TaxID=3830 RepID=A0AAN9EAI5_CROPI